MKRVRFRDPAGSVRTGEWRDGAVAFGGRRYPPEEVDVLPPSEPSKIVCVGLNFRDHAEEVDLPIPERPRLFFKPPNTAAGHGDAVALPPGKDEIDHEVELGVVIGEQCRHVDQTEAMGVIEGFTCANDLSDRVEQNSDLHVESDLVRGKAFDNACPFGPVLADPADVPADAAIELRVNGDVRQSTSRDAMVFGAAEVIADVTRHFTLEPGDLIVLGTPSGVGPLTDGDEVAIEIEGIGTLRHSVTA